MADSYVYNNDDAGASSEDDFYGLQPAPAPAAHSARSRKRSRVCVDPLTAPIEVRRNDFMSKERFAAICSSAPPVLLQATRVAFRQCFRDKGALATALEVIQSFTADFPSTLEGEALTSTELFTASFSAFKILGELEQVSYAILALSDSERDAVKFAAVEKMVQALDPMSLDVLGFSWASLPTEALAARLSMSFEVLLAFLMQDAPAGSPSVLDTLKVRRDAPDFLCDACSAASTALQILQALLARVHRKAAALPAQTGAQLFERSLHRLR
jgi:hypothetical protein